MLADLHCDTLYRCFTENKTLYDDSLHFNINKAGKYKKCIQIFAHYIPEDVTDKINYLQSMLNNSFAILDSAKEIILFNSLSDIEKAENQNKILAVLSVEGGDLFTENRSSNLDIIRFLEKNHIRFFSLCYNHGSSICGGALCPEGKSATKTALDVCSMLNEHGVVVDVSHLNHASTKAILEHDISAVATHSNCFSLCRHFRNLSDENITKLIKKSGLIGINMYSRFLGNSPVKLEEVLKHIEYIRSLGGRKCVALGADFDGCDSFPEGISDVTDMDKLYNMLSDADSVFYNNVKNFFERNFK